MTQTHALTFTRVIQAEPAEVLRAFTAPTLLRDWLSNVSSSDARLGGHLFLSWDDGYQVMGRYTHLDLPHTLTFTWLGSGDPGQTQAQVRTEVEAGGTRLTLTHSGLGDEPTWQMQTIRWNKDWPDALENLQSVLESGLDLRQTRLPRLGILFDKVTPAVIARLNLPDASGVLIEDTQEGSGAQAAGLQKDDVLTTLNGVKLQNEESFPQALQGQKAGDHVPIEFWRAGQPHSASLTLGSFVAPQYPATSAELADKLRSMFTDEMSSLRQQLAGLSDAQAAYQPSADAWSVIEIVAHLILTERDYQGWVADMLNDEPVEDWLKERPNVTPRVKALAARISSLAAMLDELALALQETVTMIVHLPPSFVIQRPHLYRRVAQWAIEITHNHYFEEHKEQFQAAIDAAKQQG